MIKNFNVKRGDQFSFTITFTNLTANPSTMNFGVKKDYESSLIISKSLNNGITKIGAGKYQIIVNPSETMLDAGMYEFDLRFTIGSVVKTPLSGTINIMGTVFE